jgi:hypothetical protein
MFAALSFSPPRLLLSCSVAGLELNALKVCVCPVGKFLDGSSCKACLDGKALTCDASGKTLTWQVVDDFLHRLLQSLIVFTLLEQRGWTSS